MLKFGKGRGRRGMTVTPVTPVDTTVTHLGVAVTYLGAPVTH